MFSQATLSLSPRLFFPYSFLTIFSSLAPKRSACSQAIFHTILGLVSVGLGPVTSVTSKTSLKIQNKGKLGQLLAIKKHFDSPTWCRLDFNLSTRRSTRIKSPFLGEFSVFSCQIPTLPGFTINKNWAPSHNLLFLFKYFSFRFKEKGFKV